MFPQSQATIPDRPLLSHMRAPVLQPEAPPPTSPSVRTAASLTASNCVVLLKIHGPSYCEVVVDELRPAEQVGQAVEGGQLAAEQLLALFVGDGVRAPQIVHWRHHAQAWRGERQENWVNLQKTERKRKE